MNTIENAPKKGQRKPKTGKAAKTVKPLKTEPRMDYPLEYFMDSPVYGQYFPFLDRDLYNVKTSEFSTSAEDILRYALNDAKYFIERVLRSNWRDGIELSRVYKLINANKECYFENDVFYAESLNRLVTLVLVEYLEPMPGIVSTINHNVVHKGDEHPDEPEKQTLADMVAHMHIPSKDEWLANPRDYFADTKPEEEAYADRLEVRNGSWERFQMRIAVELLKQLMYADAELPASKKSKVALLMQMLTGYSKSKIHSLLSTKGTLIPKFYANYIKDINKELEEIGLHIKLTTVQ